MAKAGDNTNAVYVQINLFVDFGEIAHNHLILYNIKDRGNQSLAIRCIV